MQKIIDLKAKLESGESKKYSLLRIAIAFTKCGSASPKAIAQWQHPKGNSIEFNYDIRTFEGKQKLLELASQLISKYNQATEVTAETAVTAKEQVEEVVAYRDMGDYVIQLSDEDIHEAFTVVFPKFDRILYADSEEEAHEIAIEFLIHNKSPIPIASPSTNKQSSNRLESIEWQRAQIISDADSSSLRDRLTVAKAEMSKVCLRGVL